MCSSNKMNLQLQWFAIIACFFVSVQSKKICDFLDVECMTRGANRMFDTLTGGIEGISESCDPMYQDLIVGQIRSLKYKMTNITFKGMRNCKVTRLICRPKELTMEYFLRCPHLTLKSDYETNGTLRSFIIDGCGVFTLTADDYVVKYKGNYEKNISKEDHTPRFSIKSFDIETEPMGKMAIEINELYSGDKIQCEQAINFLNQNPLEMEKIFRESIIDSFLTKFLRNVSNAVQSFHFEELVPQEENDYD